MTSSSKMSSNPERLRKAVNAALAFGPIDYDVATMDRVNRLSDLIMKPRRVRGDYTPSETTREKMRQAALRRWARLREETASGVA